MRPFTTHQASATPSRPGRSFVARILVAGMLVALVPGSTALGTGDENPANTLISPQYQPPNAAEIGAQVDAALAEAAQATQSVDVPPPAPSLAPPAASAAPSEPAPAPPPAAASGPQSDTTIAPDVETTLAANAPGDAAAADAAATPAQAPASAATAASGATNAGSVVQAAEQIATPGSGGTATQAILQQAASSSSATSAASAVQIAPTNLNVDVRIFSPGDNGPVTQTNLAGGGAVNVAASSVGGTGTAAAATPSVPTTWVWNWTWTSGACDGTAGTSSSEIAGSTWTWNWNWGCPPAAPPLREEPPLLAVATVATVASAQPAAQTSAPPARPGTHPRSAGRTASHEAAAPPTRILIAARWTTIARAATPSRSGPAATSARDQTRAPVAVPRHAPAPMDAAPPVAAAGIGGGPSGPGGVALGLAALIAALALFAPHLLLPLRIASARGPRPPRARPERPG